MMNCEENALFSYILKHFIPSAAVFLYDTCIPLPLCHCLNNTVKTALFVLPVSIFSLSLTAPANRPALGLRARRSSPASAAPLSNCMKMNFNAPLIDRPLLYTSSRSTIMSRIARSDSAVSAVTSLAGVFLIN